MMSQQPRAWLSPLLLMLTMMMIVSMTGCGSQRTREESAITPTVSTPTSISSKSSVKILVFSKTGGYRHASIKDGIAAIQKLADEHHFSADFTEDAATFNATNLAQYKAVVFLNTTGNNILDAEQKAAFERYIQAGGGYAGVHAASDTEYQWAWYDQLLGTHFKNHPSIQQATVHVVDHNHPSTSALPETWVRTDEWYNFRSNPRDQGVHVLLTLDETSYKGGTMGSDHPISWYHDFQGGRAWYTALGHTAESYTEPLFLAHLWGGIAYAANIALK